MLRNSLYLIAAIALAACGSHRERTLVLPPKFDDQVDTLRINAQLKKRKPSGKGVLVFQPLREGETTEDLSYAADLKDAGYDIFIVEFPFTDNPLEQKSSVTLTNRVYDYIHAHEHLTQWRTIEHWIYYSVGLALPWALETALNINPDSMVVYRATDQSPLENRRLLMQNDTLSTDENWVPVDEYLDVSEAWQTLVDNVEGESYSGLFVFEGLTDRLWGEWHRYPYQESLNSFGFPITWVYQENDPSISGTFFRLLQQTQGAYDNRKVVIEENQN